MKKNFKSIVSMFVVMVMSLSILTGCARKVENKGTELAQGGTIRLSVNPEIEVHYDKDGKVTELEAKNQEGAEILADYKGYEGKDAKTVVSELVEEIGKAGYFVEEVEGEKKKITLELERGSSVPNDTFIDEMVKQVKEVVDNAQWKDSVLKVDYDIDDGDEIDVYYDKNGKVTKITTESDGKKIVADSKAFEGKDIKEVVLSIIGATGEAGYFVEEIDNDDDESKVEIEIDDSKYLPSGITVEKANEYAKNEVNKVEFINAEFDIDYDAEDFIGEIEDDEYDDDADDIDDDDDSDDDDDEDDEEDDD